MGKVSSGPHRPSQGSVSSACEDLGHVVQVERQGLMKDETYRCRNVGT